MKKILISLTLLLSWTLIFAQNEDVAGSKDYDLLKRMPNFKIRKYWDYEFDSHEFRLNKSDKQQIEGRKIILRYEHIKAGNNQVKKPSYLQILRNYSRAIEEAGGEILFENKNADYGYYFLKTMQGKEIWVAINNAPDLGRRYTLTIIERESMRQDIIINADLIKEKIQLEGKIAIYGIFFDVGKSIIKPESEESLLQIATFLDNNPEINCWVVGHTDSDGSFELNSKLSLERAQAVCLYLQENHQIDSKRLFSEGVGPLAPVSTNDTEAGKQLNRRVELVKK